MRTMLSLVEQHHLLLQIVRLVVEWRKAGRDASLFQDPYARWVLARRRLLLAAAVRVSGALLLLPRISEDVASPRKRMTDWTEGTFKEDFRFRKRDFLRILHGMGLADVQDPTRPRWLRVGTDGRQSLVCSAWALMVMIKRLASTCTYRDLKKVLGGSKTLLCETFLYMLGYVYARYRQRLCDLTWFEPHVDELVRLVNAQCLHHNGMHCPVDNIIGMLDGHFMPTTRPHGKGCRSKNFLDHHVYNGKGQGSLACPRGAATACRVRLCCSRASAGCSDKCGADPDKLHGLKYQGVALPLGLGLVWGPYTTEADATMQLDSGIEAVLAAMTARRAAAHPNSAPLLLYADCAYAETLHVFKATPWATSTAQERRLNNVFKPMRVIVENLFCAASQLAPLVKCAGQGTQLGRTPAGMLYPVALFLTNLHCFFYGNCIVGSVPGAEQALSKLSVDAYLA